MIKNSNESEKIVDMFVQAYKNYDATLVIPYLSDDFHYASQWVLSEITSKTEYITYLTTKLATIKKSIEAGSSTLSIELVHDRLSGNPYMLLSQGDSQALMVFKIQNNLILRADLCMTCLYQFS